MHFQFYIRITDSLSMCIHGIVLHAFIHICMHLLNEINKEIIFKIARVSFDKLPASISCHLQRYKQRIRK